METNNEKKMKKKKSKLNKENQIFIHVCVVLSSSLILVTHSLPILFIIGLWFDVLLMALLDSSMHEKSLCDKYLLVPL